MIKFVDGPFSNFYPSLITIDGEEWDTVEHYFQAMKAVDPHERRAIKEAQTPGAAKRLGKRCKLRRGWEQVKEEVMMTGLRAKFQDPGLRAYLLATGDEEIIEDAPWDEYWGTGKTGQGKNRLGYLLMQLREEISRCSKR